MGGDGRVVLIALRGTLRSAAQRRGLAALLFGLTVLSCLFAGAQMPEEVVRRGIVNFNLLDGLPFAISLLAILAAHELGHYFMARHLGAPVSLPYFIPMPLGPFGTLGAVINMPAPARNRRQLLMIGMAGPLAGLAVAIPVLLYGLSLSEVVPLPDGGYTMEGNSILYSLLKYITFGQWLPSNGVDVFINEIAFAGWAGLLVTALNLIPAGQLDGGHVLYALFGERGARVVYLVVLGALVFLSARWPGWLLWLALLFLFGRLRMPPLDDVTELREGQRVLAALMLVLFAVVFTPAPLVLVP
jgi:membrane-associated protease RseP (regulator of RpoE activity)